MITSSINNFTFGEGDVLRTNQSKEKYSDRESNSGIPRRVYHYIAWVGVLIKTNFLWPFTP